MIKLQKNKQTDQWDSNAEMPKCGRVICNKIQNKVYI